MGIKKRFRITDSMQQVVGGFLLAGPFVVEGGTWDLAASMANINAAILGVIIMSIGYGALYKADRGRNVANERKLLGIPLRFISLMTVSVSSVYILVYLLSVQQTFGASSMTVVKAVIVTSMFSTIGAATADSIFPNQRTYSSQVNSENVASKPN